MYSHRNYIAWLVHFMVNAYYIICYLNMQP